MPSDGLCIFDNVQQCFRECRAEEYAVDVDDAAHYCPFNAIVIFFVRSIRHIVVMML